MFGRCLECLESVWEEGGRVAPELGEAVQLLGERDLEMVSRHGLMQGQRDHLVGRAHVEPVEVHAEVPRLAVAQIVSTATDIEGVGSVQLRIDGVPRVWPLGNGELTDRPLTQYDYPGLVESSQPAFPAIPSPIP